MATGTSYSQSTIATNDAAAREDAAHRSDSSEEEGGGGGGGVRSDGAEEIDDVIAALD
jgi:hypothetical protein